MANARPKLNGYDLGDEAYGLGVSTGRSWNLNLGYRLPAWNLDFQWFARFGGQTSTEYLISEGRTATKRKSGFGVHDVYVNWLPTGNDRVRVTFGVRNLFNKFYYDQGSYAYYVDAVGNSTGRGFAEPGHVDWMSAGSFDE